MILVTGASGFMGGNLVRALVARGFPVRAMIHHDRRALAGLPVEIVEGDITSPDSILRACEGIDVVYHLAATISLKSGSWDEVEATNVSGTRNIVEACLRKNVRRLVYFSSIHALNQHPLNAPVTESSQPASSIHHPPYDRSKAAGEREVRAGLARGLNAVILNPTGMIGPNDYKPSFMGQAVLMLAKGKIPALVEGGFDWVDVRDVAEAAITAELRAPSGASYILGGYWHSVREVAAVVSACTGRPAPCWVVPYQLAYTAAPLMEWFASLTRRSPIFTRVTLQALRSNRNISHARAENELDYHPRPIRETIQDTISWFRENGWGRI